LLYEPGESRFKMVGLGLVFRMAGAWLRERAAPFAQVREGLSRRA
jgi:hypothetical protein